MGEAKSKAKLAAMQEVQKKLDGMIKPLHQTARKLKEEQKKAREEAKGAAAKAFNEALNKVSEGVTIISERKTAVEAMFRQGMDDRKRLHNLVLDLKGNIRVFVRSRPINAKEVPTEPK